jgi:hypothetical protein
MTGMKTLVAAALLSAISATSAPAQEPAAFAAQNPDRDVLNGGALTPAGRIGLEQAGGAASLYAANKGFAGMGSSPAVKPQRHRRHSSR